MPLSVRSLLRRFAGSSLTTNPCRVEALEPRAMLANTPLPTLASLESPTNTVVRFETNLGDVDIELFNAAAPITVANFLNYVTSGRYDETVFHRLSRDSDPPPLGGLDVLQGGGYAYDNTFGATVISTDAPIVLERTGRSNVRGTIAMARQQAPNTATNQFFINYQDNPSLDSTAGSDGYAVFGRIIQGLATIDAIAALNSEDFSNDQRLRGLGDQIGAFGNTPVTSAFNPATGLVENVLVSIINAEVIKPAEVAGFYQTRMVSPEGFRSATTSESVTLVNTNSVEGRYQIIARYEGGGNNSGFLPGARDRVIAAGSIAPNSTATVQITSTDATFNDLTRDGSYALIVETALPESAMGSRPIVGTIRRDDFGASSEEALLLPKNYADSEMRAWSIGRIERDALSRSFVLLYNNSDRFVNITATFITPEGNRTVTRGLEAYRRGGIVIAEQEALPDGALGVRITSDQNILVSMSDWDLPAAGVDPNTANTPGWLVNALPAGGSTSGALSNVQFTTVTPGTISITNAGSISASVTLTFFGATLTTPVTTVQVALARGRTDVDLSTIAGLAAGERYAVLYASTRAVTLQYTSVKQTGRNGAGSATARDDGESTAFVTKLGTSVVLAGSFNPNRNDASQRETISIWNPLAAAGRTVAYTIEYLFSDGTRIAGGTGTLDARGRADVNTNNNVEVLNKIASGTQFRTYAILVTGTMNTGASTTRTTPGVVQLTRTDTVTGKSVIDTGTTPTLDLALGDSLFQLPG